MNSSSIPNANFLLEEVRNGFPVSAEMKAVWAVQIDLFLEFYRICQENGLKCWFDSGSLLGAVRHGGYIPWDDDIDLVMFRDDFEKMKVLAPTVFREPYFFQHADSDSQYFRWHAQFRNSETTGILNRDINQPFNQGIFIDVFVLDGYDQAVLDKQASFISRSRRLLQTRHYGKLSIHDFRKSLRYLKSVVYFFFHSDIKLFHQVDQIFSSLSVSTHPEVSCKCFADDSPVLKREWFESTVLLPFEYIQVPVPVHYHEILKTMYGESYMSPQQAPSLHGEFAVLDVAKSYRDVLPTLRKSS